MHAPWGYIGPQMGLPFLAFGGTFLAMLLSFLGFLLWPLRKLWRKFHGPRKRWVLAGLALVLVAAGVAGSWMNRSRASAQKLIILGMDGLDPKLLERFMDAGDLPNFSKLRTQGTYQHLATTNPALSPVAWATFATGANPGRHGLFDFLRRDPQTYLPILALAEVEPPKHILKLGKVTIPLGQPKLRPPRRGTPFWELTSRAKVPTTILRVPMTFPPDPVHGRMLSGLGVPDIRGTQGTFAFYTDEPVMAAKEMGGQIFQVKFASPTAHAEIVGPRNTAVKPAKDITVPAVITRDREQRQVRVDFQDQHVVLQPGQWSGWTPVVFSMNAWTKVHGIVRFYLRDMEPLRLYMSPVNFDPKQPPFPISHPQEFAEELAEEIGLYHTLGMAEDTWSLNEERVSEETYLQQCDTIMTEREAMILHGLDQFRKEGGLFVAVFDTPDRIQHMFWRLEDPKHELHDPALAERYQHVLRDVYRRMDEVVGKVLSSVTDDTLVLVVSDHGFTQFRNAVHLNTWLEQQGLLVRRPSPSAAPRDTDEVGEFFRDVDWSKSQAYATGLAGICLNLQGRERFGIVSPEQAEPIKQRIIDGLLQLTDPETKQRIMRKVFRREEIYAGQYADAAPDLVVGLDAGYRVSWQTALGGFPPAVIEPNRKKWSGDHCVDPELVPGILLSNRTFTGTEFRIMDIAPTILKFFGLEQPAEMDGRSLL